MSRVSRDEIVDEAVKNGFDYDLQVWVKDFKILDCGHPETMKADGCCEGHRMAGQDIREVENDND